MLSPCHSSSSSPVLSDGPDFLEFPVNQLSVDDESEFLFRVVEDEKFGDVLVNAIDKHEMKGEFERLENGASQADSPTQWQQQKEGENSREETPTTEMTTNSSAGCNERKSSADNKLPSSEQEKTSAEDVNTGKMSETAETSDLKIKSKRPEDKGSFEELGALTKSAAIWKRRVFTESRSHRIEISHNRIKKNSVRKLGDWSLLRNVPHNSDKYSNNYKKAGLYDVTTNLYAKKSESKRDLTPLKSARYLSLAERSGAKWLQNTVRSKKMELPPIDVVSKKRYSAHWIPQKSVPPHGEVNEYSNVQRNARKQSDSNSIVLKSVLETLEATHLGGKKRVEVLKHSLASLSRNDNQANFKKKALPLVKSALAFKNHGNKSA